MTCTWEYLVGDVRDVLARLDEQSIQCIVTSPPYWGLRDYGIPSSIWGGDPVCEHEWGTEIPPKKQHADRDHSHNDMLDTRGEQGSKKARGAELPQGAYCQKCGAWRGCLGLEPTPEMFVDHMVDVCRALWRVLRNDGTFWLNLGDCYAASPNAWSAEKTKAAGRDNRTFRDKPFGTVIGTLKPKDLVMMPHRVALALQEDGWWVRSTIVWSKPNPMPESCTDRPTSSHEYIFELVKSGKPTYWTHRDLPGVRKRPRADYRYLDLLEGTEAIDRPEEFNTIDKVPCPDCNGVGELAGWFGQGECGRCQGKGKVRRWKRINLWKGHDYFYDAEAVREPIMESTRVRMQSKCITPEENPHPDSKWPDGDFRQHAFLYSTDLERGRNLRNVWTIATQPYPKAHFATFPENIPETCIKAGTSEWGCCPQCGAPWERVIEQERSFESTQALAGHRPKGKHLERENNGQIGKNLRMGPVIRSQTKGFRPTCECGGDLEPVPCWVLDPFGGSGTTVWVGRRLRRSVIAIDINPKYKALAEERAMLDIPDIMTFKEEHNDQGNSKERK